MDLMVIATPTPPAAPHNPALAEIILSLPFDPAQFRPMIYVVDRDTMLPVVPILDYLTDCQGKRSNSLQTIRNKASALYEFFLYLDALDMDYRDVTMADIIKYKHRLEAYVSPKRLRKLAPGTINIRVRCATDFCVYHDVNDIRKEVTNTHTTIRHRTFSYCTASNTQLLSKDTTPIVESITHSDLGTIFGRLREVHRGAGLRDWLVAAFCLTTGCRLNEGLALTVARVRTAEVGTVHGGVAYIILDVTKGNVPRRIAVDRALLSMIEDYINGPRAEAVARGQRARDDTLDPNEVFLNGMSCAPALSGKPLAARRVQATFTEIQHAVGVTRAAMAVDPITGETTSMRLAAKHTFHHLRHTFAVNAWEAYEQLPEADRWMAIQAQLGHRSQATTANTYLRAVNRIESSARDVLIQYFYSLAGVRR